MYRTKIKYKKNEYYDLIPKLKKIEGIETINIVASNTDTMG